MIIQKSGPRRNAFSAKQSWGRNIQSDIKSNVLENSTNEDKHQEGIGYREAMKYLKGKLLQSH